MMDGSLRDRSRFGVSRVHVVDGRNRFFALSERWSLLGEMILMLPLGLLGRVRMSCPHHIAREASDLCCERWPALLPFVPIRRGSRSRQLFRSPFLQFPLKSTRSFVHTLIPAVLSHRRSESACEWGRSSRSEGGLAQVERTKMLQIAFAEEEGLEERTRWESQIAIYGQHGKRHSQR